MATIDTPTGHWVIGWEPLAGTFYARHHPAAKPEAAPSQHYFGATPAEILNPNQLEERLGFALPDSIHRALHANHRDKPTSVARRWRLAEAQPAEQLPAGVVPQSESRIRIHDGRDVRYGQALGESTTLRTWTRDGYRVDVRRADPFTDPNTGEARLSITYRLSYAGRVIFSGDDIDSPAGIDPNCDDTIRAVVDMLCCRTPEASYTPAQKAFLNAHGCTITTLAIGPDPPYPPGTRVAVDTANGSRRTGRVLQPIAVSGTEVIAYAWRPDQADLPGHPWHAHPDHSLVAPADHVTHTLAAPEAEPPHPAAAAPNPDVPAADASGPAAPTAPSREVGL